MNIREPILKSSSLAKLWRRALHTHPQTSFEETYASEFIEAKLKEWDIPYTKNIAETGIVATITGQTGKSEKAIGLRADMDALDIAETTDKPWASKFNGKMHACGHDGHMTMLLVAAKYLQETKNFSGKVHLIFQPAEEYLNGADRMIAEGLFSKFHMDNVYSLHNWPYLPKGKIAMRDGGIMAGDDIFSAVITGKSGHAAMPHTAKDPIPVLASILQSIQTIVSREIDPMETAVLTVTNVNAGTGANNVIPDQAIIKGSVRTLNHEVSRQIEESLNRIFKNAAAAHDMTAEISYLREVPVTVNDKQEAALCARVASDIVGMDNVGADVKPAMTAEDFASMLMQRPGCYIWIGQGDGNPDSAVSQSLHSSAYDFNDDIIPVGAEYWAR